MQCLFYCIRSKRVMKIDNLIRARNHCGKRRFAYCCGYA